MTRRAFSLLELMVVVLIFTMIMAAVLSMMAVGRQSSSVGSAMVELQGKMRLNIDMMQNEISKSSSSVVSIRAEADSDAILQGTHISGNLISFQVPVVIEGSLYANNVTREINWGAAPWGAEPAHKDWSINYFIPSDGSNKNRLIRRISAQYYSSPPQQYEPPQFPDQEYEKKIPLPPLSSAPDYLNWLASLISIAYASNGNDTILADGMTKICFKGFDQNSEPIENNPECCCETLTVPPYTVPYLVQIDLYGEKQAVLGPTLKLKLSSKVKFRN